MKMDMLPLQFNSDQINMFTNTARRTALWLLLSAPIFTSCNKHFTVQKNEYQQYGVDNQMSVDSSVVKYYLPYKQKMEAEMSRVIGETEKELSKPSDPETLIGNFYADAILEEVLKVDPSIQISFPTTKGGIRNPLPKGKISVENIFELMPFENELVKIKLSGKGVQKLINFIAKSQGQPIAGLRMKVKNGVVSDVLINGKPLDLNQNYFVVTSDYLANSGDDQSVFATVMERDNLGKKVRDTLMDYIANQTKNGKKINAELDGRVVITND